MKSPMITHAPYIEDHAKAFFTDLQVIWSAAGFYVGTMFVDGDCIEPGSRDSGYFGSEAEAATELRRIELGLVPTRMHP